jgi:succinate dehydrogenase / fumarate reductase, membrane anchor subunit
VLVGVHSIDLDYVALRWGTFGWRLCDFFLLAFAFAHGMNGLRQVLLDYIKDPAWIRRLTWGLLAIWLLLSSIGAIAILGGVRQS